MKKLTTVLALSMMSVFASAHEGEDHSQTSAASTAADCSQLQSMQAKGSMNMNDPVVQALMQKCHEQMNNLHGNMMNNGQNMMNNGQNMMNNGQNMMNNGQNMMNNGQNMMNNGQNMMNNGQNMMNGNSTGQAMGNMHNHDQ